MISVVMALYNGEKYLREQLDSIRMQTITPDELIMVDDCSTDHTVELVKSYIEEHHLQDNWLLYENSENVGYGNNFHRAVHLSHGDYVFFADQDDIWELNKIQLMVNIMETHADCNVLCSDYEPWTVTSGAAKVPKSVKKRMPNNGELEKVQISRKNFYLKSLGCCMCVRGAFYKENDKYWYDQWAHDDRVWKLGICSDSCYIIHQNLIKHRLHSNNTASFSKIRTKSKRISTFTNHYRSVEQALFYLNEKYPSSKWIRLLRSAKDMFLLRIDFIKNPSILKLIRLIPYIPYYEVPRSYLFEIYAALKKT